jgi:hypothetical protein
MTNISKRLKLVALAGFSALAIAAIASPASAHSSYVRCDRDGDRCWRVVCDRDGDDCRRYPIYSGGRYDRDNRYRYNARRWVCDRRGRDCHWIYADRGDYRGRDGVSFRVVLGD